MTVQLSLTEVQVAVTDYLRKRGVIVDDADQVKLVNFSTHTGYVNIANVTPMVVVHDAKLPETPYR